MDYEKKYNEALEKARYYHSKDYMLEELKPQWRPTTKQIIELDHLISGCSCEIEIVKKLKEELVKLKEL